MDLFAFSQDIPKKRKQQRPEVDDWLYVSPRGVPPTYKVIDGKKTKQFNQAALVSQYYQHLPKVCGPGDMFIEPATDVCDNRESLTGAR